MIMYIPPKAVTKEQQLRSYNTLPSRDAGLLHIYSTNEQQTATLSGLAGRSLFNAHVFWTNIGELMYTRAQVIYLAMASSSPTTSTTQETISTTPKRPVTLPQADTDSLDIKVVSAASNSRLAITTFSQDTSVAFTLQIPNRLLYAWYTNKENLGNIITLVNSSIAGRIVRLKEGNPRIKDRLGCQIRKVGAQCSKLRSRKRYIFLTKEYYMKMSLNRLRTLYKRKNRKLQNCYMTWHTFLLRLAQVRTHTPTVTRAKV